MSTIFDFLSQTVLSEQLVGFILFAPGAWLVTEVGRKRSGWKVRSMLAYLAMLVPFLLVLALGVTGKASVLQMTSALAGGVFGPMLGSLLSTGGPGASSADPGPQAGQVKR